MKYPIAEKILGEKLARKLHRKKLQWTGLAKRWMWNYNQIGDRRLVDFLICGTQKGGTSTLYSYLKEHLSIYMPDIKEIHFFDNESAFKNGEPDYSEYHSFFSPNPEHKIIGEATPIYMYWYNSPKRIWKYNPHMKLIVLLRNPITRAYSHWNMSRMLGIEKLSFWDAIQKEDERCKEVQSYQRKNFSYIDRGFYVEQLRRIWRFFPKKNVIIIKSEHL